MAKSMAIAKAKERLRMGYVLMATYVPAGTVFSVDGCGEIAPRHARALIGNGNSLNPESKGPAQGDLFLMPNEDGLFPGFSQTWSAL